MNNARNQGESKSIIPGFLIIIRDHVVSHYKNVESEGVAYGLEFYKEPHANDYTLYELKDGFCEGLVQLYRFGLLLYSWSVHDGKPEGDLTVYDNGMAVQTVNWSYYLKNDDKRCVQFSPNGSVLVIFDRSTKKMIYRGDYEREGLIRSGLGIVCNKDTEKEELYGYFEEDRMVHIKQRFLGDGNMVEYDDNKEDNTALESQRPVYYGGYAFDREKEVFVRHGKGRLFHIFTGMMQYEGTWNMGKENEKGTKYTDGKNEWRINNYSLRELVDKVANNAVKVDNSTSLETLSCSVSDLHICHSYRNSAYFSFSSLHCLRTLQLDDNACNQKKFILSNIPFLKSVSIGRSCNVTVDVGVLSDG